MADSPAAARRTWASGRPPVAGGAGGSRAARPPQLAARRAKQTAEFRSVSLRFAICRLQFAQWPAAYSVQLANILISGAAAASANLPSEVGGNNSNQLRSALCCAFSLRATRRRAAHKMTPRERPTRRPDHTKRDALAQVHLLTRCRIAHCRPSRDSAAHPLGSTGIPGDSVQSGEAPNNQSSNPRRRNGQLLCALRELYYSNSITHSIGITISTAN